MTDFERDVIDGLARIETRFDSLEHELLGNGQPGRIQQLESKVSSHAEYIQGAKARAAVIGALAAGVVTFLIALAKVAFASVLK
jgi:hypothetical protein